MIQELSAIDWTTLLGQKEVEDEWLTIRYILQRQIENHIPKTLIGGQRWVE
jgi:hypothetical protein